MPRRRGDDRDLRPLLHTLTDIGDEAPSLDEKIGLTQLARSESAEASGRIDRFLVGEVDRLRREFDEMVQLQGNLGKLLEQLTTPPLHLAIYLGTAEAADGEVAIVAHGGARRAVVVGPDVDRARLQVGEDVLLNDERNVLVRRSTYRASVSGETALFDRYCPDGRLVLRSHDEDVVVEPTGDLVRQELRSGDRVRWDRSLWIAFEKIERATGERFFLEETPAERFEDVGGLGRQVEALQRSLRLHREHPEVVRRYRLRRNRSVLLVGPPGTGKTLVARALANWLAARSESGRSRFMNIKPSGLHSVWHSQSEANYREAFRVAREVGEAQPDVPVVMFFDEVDAIGAARGRSYLGVDDRILTAFMAELDGLESRGNVLVVAATNRRQSLDPALLRPGRLGDLVLEVPRPDRAAASEIFAVHLHPDVPYAHPEPAGDGAEARQELIETATSRIYAPNAEADLATLTFRDGVQRTLRARDLVSGAVIANVVRRAMERACLREIESGATGLGWSDLLAAIEEEFEAAARSLSATNCHRHVDNLPQDVDVVRVEQSNPQGRRVHRYLNVA